MPTKRPSDAVGPQHRVATGTGTAGHCARKRRHPAVPVHQRLPLGARHFVTVVQRGAVVFLGRARGGHFFLYAIGSVGTQVSILETFGGTQCAERIFEWFLADVGHCDFHGRVALYF